LTEGLYSEIGLEDLCTTSMNLVIQTYTETARLQVVLAAARISIIHVYNLSLGRGRISLQALNDKCTVGLHINREK